MGSQCTSPGKHPRINNWQSIATTNHHVVASWWKRWPTSNIGITTGEDFGVVLDFDPRHGSDDSLIRLEADHGSLPGTRTTKTGSGGSHRIYVYPTGLSVTNKVPSVVAIYEGIDVRGQGGYIAAPGTDTPWP